MSEDKERNFKDVYDGLKELPEIESEKYVVSEELYGAVQAAIATGQPLLLAGEPGTGKTRLASKLAYDLSLTDHRFDSKIEKFDTKTTSCALDLFYSYDALRHFNDANIQKATNKAAPGALPYINLAALGKAIAMTSEQDYATELLKSKTNGETKSKVVLIDEIDKAPRDFTNDILNEIDNMEFEIRELQRGGEKIKRGKEHRIVVIMTSNSEKNLPDAFLRRCAFFHIPFPGDNLLCDIVQMHFPDNNELPHEEVIGFFKQLREVSTRKKPATAELISWLHVLEILQFFKNFKSFSQLNEAQKRDLKFSLSVLVKTKEDLEAVQEFIT
ncbi:MAG: AAA family ATPase [Gammaproteobacteria bacterium]|nr:AAA family ATPase [Gammaproteobacteria bacterium]